MSKQNMMYLRRRPGTENWSYVQRIPKAIHPKLVGRTLLYPVGSYVAKQHITPTTPFFEFSLRTADPQLLELRRSHARAYILSLVDSLTYERDLNLTYPQLLALAGELYAAWSKGPLNESSLTWDSETGVVYSGPIQGEEGFDARVYEEKAQEIEDLLDNGDLGALEVFYDFLGAKLLADHGIALIGERSRETLIVLMARYHAKAMRQAAKAWRGDFTPDVSLIAIPKWDDAKPVSITELVDKWWKEAESVGKTQSTMEGYKATLKLFSEFVKHDDARKITKADIVAFKDFRLHSVSTRTGRKISPKTVKAGDMAALGSIFKWAVSNHLLATNPTEGAMGVQSGRKTHVREREFTKDEAKAILKASSKITSPKNLTELAERWVPWLCAYSGCRLGEAIQLRKEDLRFDQETQSWVMRITPEAGTVKTKEYRDIPLHPHITEQGFMDQCVNSQLSSGSPYLFLVIKPDATFRGVWRSKKNRLREFAREIVTDPNVAPNHAWRHTFKSIGFEIGIQEKVLDSLCGHAQASVGRDYGSVTLKTKVDAIAQFPKWTIGD